MLKTSNPHDNHLLAALPTEVRARLFPYLERIVLPLGKLTMTQELIANMLGVRREGVTEAAGKLQELGVIEYKRGHISVLDRARLERLSCECYAVVKKETDRLLPYVPPMVQR